MGQTQATKKAVLLKPLLQELHISSFAEDAGKPSTQPDIYSVIIHCDDKGAIALAKNTQANARSKHIDIQ